MTVSQRGKAAVQILSKDGVMVFLGRLGTYLERRANRLSAKMHKVQTLIKQQEVWPVEKPLVSIVIPCYNYGRFIEGAIASVRMQTFQRFEIIVINDGSTDELTLEVLQYIGDEKTKVIHQPNQGLARTRNNGAVLAAGKYICYLDPDDLFEPTYLEKTLSLLETDESLGSCYSWVQCFGDIESVWQTEDLEPLLLRQFCMAPSQSVIRKEAWVRVKEQNGSGFLTKYDGYFEDWVFWIDMVQCGYRGHAVQEPLIRYRVHETSLGATHKPGWNHMLPALYEDRKKFFFDRSYRRQLEKMLNKRIYVQNNRINLYSTTLPKSEHVSA